jgi:ribonuclease D
MMVRTAAELENLREALSSQPRIAVDTESNSLYAYQEQVCLMQFSIPGADYVLDMLAGLDVAWLGALFADPNVEKVFHAAEYDVMCLRRDYGFEFVHLFDTMWAARVLGWKRFGLGSILEDKFGVHTNKRYQRYNWGERPLDPKALTYACLDTHYLLSLREMQAQALKERGLWEEAQHHFAGVAASEPTFTAFDPEDFWRVKGAWDLSRRQRAVLRELYIWRDQVARRRDRPPFKVLNDHILVALAQAQPSTPKGIKSIRGLKSYHARRYGKGILRAIRHGRRAPFPEPPPRPPRHSEAEVDRYETLRSWRNQLADHRGVEPDVVMTNAVLWAVAEQDPDTLDELSEVEELEPWRQERYGEAMLDVLD